ncbi:MAG: hypothetical protein IJ833_07740 [Lachnospiraceae bacterium]|nr:hypothetical protein [Lachnospiraceae bacterium]
MDHRFQWTGFDKKRLFYTQGDYGLWQCSKHCHQETYDNEETVKAMVEAQGFNIGEDGALLPPVTEAGKTDFSRLKMVVPSKLLPHCPICGEPMSMNLRADHTFVEDEGWHKAAERYHDFLRRHRGLHTVFLDLGCGSNTPGIFKYPFWQMTAEQEKAVYACINLGEAYAPMELGQKAMCIDGDIGQVLDKLSV